METLEQACAASGWDVYAWVLMTDHLDLVVETPLANLVPRMKWFLESRRMEALRRDREQACDYKRVRRGWRFETEEFLARMLDRVDGNNGESGTRQETKVSMEQRAERVEAEELARCSWDEQRLETKRKGHPAKVKIARILRREITATSRWIAEWLKTGARTRVSFLFGNVEKPRRKPNEKRPKL